MSSQGITARFDTSAYAKILLHGAKHSTAPVIGLLMGTRNGSEVTVQTIFPVLHSPPVGPLLDVAISIAPTMFPELIIVGVYFSNDRCDSDISPVYIPRLVKSMAEKGVAAPCMVVQLKNALIEKLDALCINGTQEGQSVALVVQDLTPSQLNAAIQSSGLTTQHNIRKFTDFEDHSVEIDSQKQEDKDSDRNDFRNLFVDALAF